MSSRDVFAASVRALRTARRLSQEKLAELSGLHRTYISSVERGERNVSVDNMERIAAALGLELHDLLGAAGCPQVRSPGDAAGARPTGMSSASAGAPTMTMTTTNERERYAD